MKPLLITSGEPAGVGPDICLALAKSEIPVVVMGHLPLFQARAKRLGLDVRCRLYHPDEPVSVTSGELTILSHPLQGEVVAGELNPLHSTYVMQMLSDGCQRVLANEFSALVTAPVHKGVLNQAGFMFSGHTEFLKQQCQAPDVVMLLASPMMKVALVTTHLPLREVPDAITKVRLEKVISLLDESLHRDFGIRRPKIVVAGLNPHAGEQGYLGREELDVIYPVIQSFQQKGLDVIGPLPADTVFAAEPMASVFLTMYHDQGLPVIKYADFEHAVNVTLGLPIVRTSVDHGTALTLAGTKKANPSSLLAAVKLAHEIVLCRGVYDAHH